MKLIICFFKSSISKYYHFNMQPIYIIIEIFCFFSCWVFKIQCELYLYSLLHFKRTLCLLDTPSPSRAATLSFFLPIPSLQSHWSFWGSFPPLCSLLLRLLHMLFHLIHLHPITQYSLIYLLISKDLPQCILPQSLQWWFLSLLVPL